MKQVRDYWDHHVFSVSSPISWDWQELRPPSRPWDPPTARFAPTPHPGPWQWSFPWGHPNSWIGYNGKSYKNVFFSAFDFSAVWQR